MTSNTPIPTDELIEGGIYDVNSRNLLTAVYNGHRGFVGIRLKFDSRYLFTEVLNDPPGYGTAWPMEYLGQIPSGIDPVEGWSLGGKWKSNLRLYQILEAYPHG